MRSPGRPRNPQLHDAAIEATIALIVEGGYHALTMERVAHRASVSKAALYRRWPNKLELTVDAIGRLASAVLTVSDTGDVRRDLLEFLHSYVNERRADARTYEALSAAVLSDPELTARCRDTVVAGFTAIFRGIIARAVQRGQLPPDTDIELLGDVVPALVRNRRHLTGQPLDAPYIDRIVAQFFTPDLHPDTPDRHPGSSELQPSAPDTVRTPGCTTERG